MRIFLIIFSCLFYSCINYGGYINRNINHYLENGVAEAFSDSALSQYKDVVIFFGKPINTPLDYLEVGSISTEGAKYTTDDELLGQLKLAAFELNAHAVINAKTSFKERELGYYWLPNMTRNTSETYQAKVYTGIAIRYKSKHTDLVTQTIRFNDTIAAPSIR